MLEIKLDNQLQNFLRKCDKILFDRISQKLKELKENPVLQNAKRLMGYDSIFRIGIGKYRV